MKIADRARAGGVSALALAGVMALVPLAPDLAKAQEAQAQETPAPAPAPAESPAENPAEAGASLWLQIEARPSQAAARARAAVWARDFGNLQGFATRTGWVALALGPYGDRAAATALLAQLKAAGRIPADSFLAEARSLGPALWPEGLAVAPQPEAPLAPQAIAPTPETAPEPAPAPAPAESLAEAQAAEAALSPQARQDLQRALAWAGHYQGPIDGAIGRGSRAAMAAWQAAQGAAPSGVLTQAQRQALTEAYQRDQAALGLRRVEEAEAGLSADLPLALVRFDRYDPPFLRYAPLPGGDLTLLLISQTDAPGALAALAGRLQAEAQALGEQALGETAAAAAPLTAGATQLAIDRARPSGGRLVAEAQLSSGLIKGFAMIWGPGADPALMARVLQALRDSLQASGDHALDPSLAVAAAQSGADLTAPLLPPEPAWARSGVYVAADGLVLTLAEGLAGCGRLTLDGGVAARLRGQDPGLGLALLAPERPLAPAAIARLAPRDPAPGARLAVAGFAYARHLDMPLMTFGQLQGAGGLAGEPGLWRLDLPALEGDGGGALVDGSGALVGLVAGRDLGAQRSALPSGASLAHDRARIAGFLADHGVADHGVVAQPSPVSALGGASPIALAAEDLARQALPMAVRVSCWN